jgi:hypothetical protein
LADAHFFIDFHVKIAHYYLKNVDINRFSAIITSKMSIFIFFGLFFDFCTFLPQKFGHSYLKIAHFYLKNVDFRPFSPQNRPFSPQKRRFSPFFGLFSSIFRPFSPYFRPFFQGFAPPAQRFRRFRRGCPGAAAETEAPKAGNCGILRGF